MKNLDQVVRRAIRAAPCTMRALAREAGVSHVTLHRILTGHEHASRRVSAKVASALRRWAAGCEAEATAIENQLKQKEDL